MDETTIIIVAAAAILLTKNPVSDALSLVDTGINTIDNALTSGVITSHSQDIDNSNILFGIDLGKSNAWTDWLQSWSN
jgi:hypothetical protein